MKTIKTAVIGASGYTGLELIKVLLDHPKFEVIILATSEGNTDLQTLHSSFLKIKNMPIDKLDIEYISKEAELVFLALPHKTSAKIAKEFLKNGLKVVDLSADYRLELDVYEKFYTSHEDKANLKNAVYGLPEIYRQEIKKTNLVANPGCYPTASILALLPFLDFIDENEAIMIDAKSGVSGAGKKLSQTTHFCTINENMFAYNPLKHRHFPEIQEKLFKKSNKNFNIIFVPHLIPLTRGMLVSVFVKLSRDIDAYKILQDYYKNEPFIRIRKEPVSIKDVCGTNFCDIFALTKDNILFISSTIDNLLKGASSAAVVNANLMFDFEEDLGIPKLAYVP
jgi:N-acetyl-gamma-glutamyl-phosphate reductase